MSYDHKKLLGDLLMRLDPDLRGALEGADGMPEASAWFEAIFNSLPGTLTEKVLRLVAPRHVGVARDARHTAVRAIDTGELWLSVREAAAAIGCSPGTLRNHLCGHGRQWSIGGRVFERAPSPHALDISTPEKLGAYRAQCRAAGFEPTR